MNDERSRLMVGRSGVMCDRSGLGVECAIGGLGAWHPGDRLSVETEVVCRMPRPYLGVMCDRAGVMCDRQAVRARHSGNHLSVSARSLLPDATPLTVANHTPIAHR